MTLIIFLDRDVDGRQNRKDRKKTRNQRRKDRLLDDADVIGPSVVPEIDERKGPWNDNTDDNIQHQTPGM